LPASSAKIRKIGNFSLPRGILRISRRVRRGPTPEQDQHARLNFPGYARGDGDMGLGVTRWMMARKMFLYSDRILTQSPHPVEARVIFSLWRSLFFFFNPWGASADAAPAGQRGQKNGCSAPQRSRRRIFFSRQRTQRLSFRW